MKSLRTSLASRTHFEVLGLALSFEGQVLGLGLGLEASSFRKLPCPRLEDSTIFCTVEILLENARNLGKFANTFLVFLIWSINVANGGARPPSQLKFHQWQKCDKKAYCFFSFFLAFCALTVTNNNFEDQERRAPSSQFLLANLNV